MINKGWLIILKTAIAFVILGFLAKYFDFITIEFTYFWLTICAIADVAELIQKTITKESEEQIWRSVFMEN